MSIEITTKERLVQTYKAYCELRSSIDILKHQFEEATTRAKRLEDKLSSAYTLSKAYSIELAEGIEAGLISTNEEDKKQILYSRNRTLNG